MNRKCPITTYYFVEGDCEEKLVRSLIDDFAYLASGRVKVLNTKQKKIGRSLLLDIKRNSRIVFIFDTDVDQYDFLIANIKAIKNLDSNPIICLIPQNSNLEDELIRSCKIKQIKELTHSKSNRDFKRDFLKSTNTKSLLEQCSFEFDRIWTGSIPSQIKNHQVIRYL